MLDISSLLFSHPLFSDPNPPVSYDLNFIDLSKKQTKKSNQTTVFKLSTPATSPTEEEDSIAKVLDWFSRSTDSSDWLNTDDRPEVVTSPEPKDVKISKLKGDNTLRKEAADVLSDLLKKKTDGNEEVRETDGVERVQVEKVQAVKIETSERIRPQEREQEVKKVEKQQNQVSHLKSFWERSKIGPKIVIIKSMMPKDKGKKPAQLSVEEEEKNVTGHSREVTYAGEREQQLVITEDRRQLNSKPEVNNPLMNTQRIFEDNPQVADRRVSDSDILSSTRLRPQPRTTLQSRLHQGSENVFLVQSNPQSDGISRFGEPVSELNPDLKTSDGPDSENPNFSRTKDVAVSPETQQRRGSNKDTSWWDSDDASLESSMSPKRKDGTSNRERIDDSKGTADKIKQLRSFWEQERKTSFCNGKPKPLGDGRVNGGANQSKMSKRFTKSEYDLRSLSTEEEAPNFSVVPFNQRIEKSSPSLSASRTQFNTLLEFWDEASSDTKRSPSPEKNKSPKKKEPQNTQLSSEESKTSESETYIKSSPPLQNQAKQRAAQDSKNSQSNYIMAVQQRDAKKNSKDLNREEKSKPLNSPGKEIRSTKSRRDSFETSSSRANSMRRAASMFALCAPEDDSETQPKLDKSPVHSPSRRQRQNGDKGAMLKKTSEEVEPPTPRARACVPRDYRHYLGMTHQTSVHTSLAPAPKKEGSGEQFGYELDLGGPVRTSTPVSSEERYSRKSGKLSQRPLWSNYSSSDTGQESSLSSPTNSRSNSRNSSNRTHHP